MQYLVTSLSLYHVTIISTNGRSVSGHMAPSVILCIYEFLYNFDTVLYQFLETRTSDRINISRDQLLKCLDFSLYPLSFYQNSQFKCRLFNTIYLANDVTLPAAVYRTRPRCIQTYWTFHPF